MPRKIIKFVINRIIFFFALFASASATLAQKIDGQFIGITETVDYRYLLNKSSVRYIDAYAVVTAGIKREFKGAGLIKFLNNDKDRYDMVMVDCSLRRGGAYESSWINSENELSKTVLINKGIGDESNLGAAKAGTILDGIINSICSEYLTIAKNYPQFKNKNIGIAKLLPPVDKNLNKWINLGEVINPTQRILVDENSIQRSSDSVFTIEMAGIYESVQNFSGLRVKFNAGIYIFECDRKRFSMKYLEEFDPSGIFINSISVTPDETQWNNIESASLLSPFLNKYCYAEKTLVKDDLSVGRRHMVPTIENSNIWSKVGNSADGQNEFFVAFETIKNESDGMKTVNLATKLGFPIIKKGKSVDFTSDLVSVDCIANKFFLLEQDFYSGNKLVDVSIATAKQFRNYETPTQGSIANSIISVVCKRDSIDKNPAITIQPSNFSNSSSKAEIKSYKNAHALVIGNGSYPGAARLDNPVNDANSISQKLRSMGFTVTTVTDANRQRLVQAMAQFRRSAAAADISLLFYAGHGVQIFGTNYMLPTDVDQTDPAQATIQGVSLNSVVENFLPGKTKLVFLDACRDNPLQRTNDRSVSKGLAPISAAEGTLISYATKDGQTAADGVGTKNSPFTQALLEHLNDPQDIAVVLRKVREKVMKATGGKQQPWEYGSLTGGELVLSRIKGGQ
jgi:hypothetical protein